MSGDKSIILSKEDQRALVPTIHYLSSAVINELVMDIWIGEGERQVRGEGQCSTVQCSAV